MWRRLSAAGTTVSPRFDRGLYLRDTVWSEPTHWPMRRRVSDGRRCLCPDSQRLRVPTAGEPPVQLRCKGRLRWPLSGWIELRYRHYERSVHVPATAVTVRTGNRTKRTDLWRRMPERNHLYQP